MLEVRLKGHEKYYCVSDVVRLFYDGLCEDKERGAVTAESGPDLVITCALEPDGRSVTSYDGRKFIPEGEPLEAGREIRRSLYLALAEISGRTMPWGCLTGIRPTLVAYEEKTLRASSRDTMSARIRRSLPVVLLKKNSARRS